MRSVHDGPHPRDFAGSGLDPHRPAPPGREPYPGLLRTLALLGAVIVLAAVFMQLTMILFPGWPDIAQMAVPTQLALAVEAWRRRTGPALGRWLTVIGDTEALAALATFAYENPAFPFPEVLAEGPVLDGQGLGHPLLPRAGCVTNDLTLNPKLRLLVVSGSNMSGKSTFLRTVGVNAVLAQAGAPVRARRLRLSPVEIGASIRIQDSLQAGVSRFYAEITRLGVIMRHAGEGPVLFLIDELLHGTNSHDRRIGAEAVVRGLVERGAIGLVTTHDLALAHVADALGARGANVHFQDVLEDGQIRFDYRMRPGVVQKSNALELMRSIGLDV